MQVFHGSDVKIEKIDINKCEYFRDFGRGFYVTNIRAHAYMRDNITGNILEAMVVELKMTESAAIKMFYSSNSYEKLSNADTLLWQKPWQEIYETFKEELRTIMPE